MMNEVKRKQKGSSCLPVKEGNKGMNLNRLFPWNNQNQEPLKPFRFLVLSGKKKPTC